MNANKLFIPLLLTLPLLAACEETVETAAPVPLTFSTTVEGAQTRYAADDLPGSMGVFAYYTEKSNFNASTSTPNFMYNQLMTRNGTAWNYTPLKYWPTNASDKVSFFAYAPHNASGLVPCGNTQKGYPWAAYTVAQAENDQIDLLASTPLINKSAEAVSFTLRHALTKVTLKVKSGDKYAKEITSLSINAATNGNLYFKDGGFEWRNVTGTYSYVPATTNLSFTTTDQERDMATFYLLPTATVTATYSITYKVKTTAGSEVLTRTFTASPLSATPLWTAGGHVSYTINLSEKTATVTAELTEWEKDANNGFDVETYFPDDFKVGDYYYDDGSWSDGGLRAYAVGTNVRVWESAFPAPVTTNPVTGIARNVIGIVFSTTTSDTDKAHGWTRGYAMGLRKYDSPWEKVKAGYNTAIADGGDAGDFDGYTKCQTLMTDAEWIADSENFPAFHNTCIVHNANFPAPAATSQWYLPSAGQLTAIFNNVGGGVSNAGLDYLGKQMGKASNTTVSLSKMCLYYSSNEKGNEAWLIMYYGGGALVRPQYGPKIPNDGRAINPAVFPVLAF